MKHFSILLSHCLQEINRTLHMFIRRTPIAPTTNVIPGRATTLPFGSGKTPLPNLRSTPIPNGKSASFVREEPNETSPMLNQSATTGSSSHDHRAISEMTSLAVWLAQVGLPQYKENFTRCGCSSIEQINQLTLRYVRFWLVFYSKIWVLMSVTTVRLRLSKLLT